MKILLYTGNYKQISKSGLGKAIKHQMKALESAGVEYTLDPKDDYDILHINTYFLESYIQLKKSKILGKKIVYHAHSTKEDYIDGFNFAKYTSNFFKSWLITCYSEGDVIITPTEYSKKLLSGYKGLEDKKIYSLSNGIQLEKFKRNEKSGQKLREKYNIKKTDKLIIGIGLYIRRKGIVDFVELAKRLPNYKFIWFGESPLELSTSDVVEAVNTKLPNLIFAGYVENKEINAAMSTADLYLFPTLEETEGIPVLEAAACKTQALIRDIPVFDGWLIDGENVYKAKDIDDFEEKIVKILEKKLPSLVENAYKLAEERDIKIIGQKLKQIYEEVLK